MPCPRWPDVKCPGGERVRTVLAAILAAANGSADPLADIVHVDAMRWLDRPADAPLSCAERCARIESARAAVRLDPPHWDLAHRILDDVAPPAPPRKRKATSKRKPAPKRKAAPKRKRRA